MSGYKKSKMISRRAFGGISLAGAALAGVHGQAAAQTQKADSFSSNAEMVRALRKMRSNTDGSVRSGWLKAKRFSYIDGDVRPLLLLLAGTISTSSDNGDGTFDITLVETTYYLDVETEELLDTLPMPGTGKIVDVPLYRSGPGVVTVGARTEDTEFSTGGAGVVDEDGEQATGAFAPRGNVTLDRSVGPAIVEGNTVWIPTEEYGQVFPTDSNESRVFYKESAIWQGELDELVDPNVTAASAKLTYTAATSWRPWMEMGDVKGHTMSSGIGATCNSLDEMPDEWLRLTSLHHPDILEDPEGVLRGDS